MKNLVVYAYSIIAGLGLSIFSYASEENLGSNFLDETPLSPFSAMLQGRNVEVRSVEESKKTTPKTQPLADPVLSASPFSRLCTSSTLNKTPANFMTKRKKRHTGDQAESSLYQSFSSPQRIHPSAESDQREEPSSQEHLVTIFKTPVKEPSSAEPSPFSAFVRSGKRCVTPVKALIFDDNQGINQSPFSCMLATSHNGLKERDSASFCDEEDFFLRDNPVSPLSNKSYESHAVSPIPFSLQGQEERQGNPIPYFILMKNEGFMTSHAAYVVNSFQKAVTAFLHVNKNSYEEAMYLGINWVNAYYALLRSIPVSCLPCIETSAMDETVLCDPWVMVTYINNLTQAFTGYFLDHFDQWEEWGVSYEKTPKTLGVKASDFFTWFWVTHLPKSRVLITKID